jgi:hypothetical protein
MEVSKPAFPIIRAGKFPRGLLTDDVQLKFAGFVLPPLPCVEYSGHAAHLILTLQLTSYARACPPILCYAARKATFLTFGFEARRISPC